jgi:hypothetical protein
MRLPDTAHTSRPWRIHELTPDFRVEDVWQLPVEGARADLPRVVEVILGRDPQRSQSFAVRSLFALRWKLGALFGWDDAPASEAAGSLRERLPPDLRERPGPDFETLPFSPLYLTDDEFAAEIANRTMHGVVHFGWVHESGERYGAQMAVLVKPNGLFGRAYMAAIKPFRHLFVYPAMLREGGRRWRAEQQRASRA